MRLYSCTVLCCCVMLYFYPWHHSVYILPSYHTVTQTYPPSIQPVTSIWTIASFDATSKEAGSLHVRGTVLLRSVIPVAMAKTRPPRRESGKHFQSPRQENGFWRFSTGVRHPRWSQLVRNLTHCSHRLSRYPFCGCATGGHHKVYDKVFFIDLTDTAPTTIFFMLRRWFFFRWLRICRIKHFFWVCLESILLFSVSCSRNFHHSGLNIAGKCHCRSMDVSEQTLWLSDMGLYDAERPSESSSVGRVSWETSRRFSRVHRTQDGQWQIAFR